MTNNTPNNMPKPVAQETQKRKGRWWKIPAWIIGGFFAIIIVAAIITNMINPPNDTAPASAETTTTQNTQDTTDPAAEQTETTNTVAARTEQALLDTYGFDQMIDGLTDPNVPAESRGNLMFYIVDFASPSDGTVQLTVQESKDNITKDEAQQLALTVFQLTGLSVEDLDRIEVYSGDGIFITAENRYNVPLLNR